MPSLCMGLQEGLGAAVEAQHGLWQVEANTTQVQEQHQLLTRDPILLVNTVCTTHSFKSETSTKAVRRQSCRVSLFSRLTLMQSTGKGVLQRKRWNFQCWCLWHLEVTFSRNFLQRQNNVTKTYLWGLPY